MNPLTSPRYNCSAIVMQQRFIYLMPGGNLGAVRNTSLLIEYMNTGNDSEFNPTMVNSISYGACLSRKMWESLEVKDPAFFRAQPVCGFTIADGSKAGNKICIFGGQSVN